MKDYREAARLLSIVQVQKAGARHSASDNTLIQQAHDALMALGAECKCEGRNLFNEMFDAGVFNQQAEVAKAAIDALVLRHPGHPNQKTHGNRFGAGQAKESLRRLKDDKGARERYKAKARKERASKQASADWWNDFVSGKIDAPKPRATKPKAPRPQSAPKSNFYRKYKTQTKEFNPLGSDRSAAASLDASGGGMGAASAMTRRPGKK